VGGVMAGSREFNRILVTGGAGFIGSHFVERQLAGYPRQEVVVLDAFTYAGNLANLEFAVDDQRFRLVRGDIRDAAAVADAIRDCDAVVNFAAETHVDRSIMEPLDFARTDVIGVGVLLEACRERRGVRFHQISTDEVYGAVPDGLADEDHPLRPTSPYSASKTGGELLVQAYHKTYGQDTVITRGANTYGSRQYPEKALPLFITNAIEDQPLPLYGKGTSVRTYTHVLDIVEGIDVALRQALPGAILNVGRSEDVVIGQMARAVLDLLGKPASLLAYVPDRPGHDFRYALDTTRLRRLGWRPKISWPEGLASTVHWYLQNPQWWRPIKSGEFKEYYRRQYATLAS